MSEFAKGYKKAQLDCLNVYDIQKRLKQEDLKTFFSHKGVNLKSNLATFNGRAVTLLKVKYGPSCKFGDDWMRSTRGLTMIEENNQRIATYFPMNKFFNFGEFPKHEGMTPKDFCFFLEKQGLKSIMMNKLDGTNIQTCYPFGPNGAPLSMTLGSVNAEVLMQPKITGSPTFSALSLKLLEEQHPNILEYLRQHPKQSLVSELCSGWNVIVTVYTQHGEGKITPLVIIDEDGICGIGVLRQLAPELFNTDGFPLGSMPLSTDTFEADQTAFMSNVEAHPESFGRIPEGFVAYAFTENNGLPDKFFPWGKKKLPEYRSKHLKVCLNPGTDKDLMAAQELEIAGKYDDARGGLGAELRDPHIDEFRIALAEILRKFKVYIPALCDAQSQKDYAAVVKQLPNELKWMQAALFKIRGFSRDEFINISDEFVYSSLGGDTLCKLHATYGLRWWKFKVIVTSASNKPKLQLDPKLEDPKLEDPKLGDQKLDPKNRFLVLCDFDGTFVESTPIGHHILSSDLKVIPSTGKALYSYAVMGAEIVILTGRSEELTEAIKNFVESELAKLSPSLEIAVIVRARPATCSILDHKIMAAADQLNSGKFGTVVHFEDDKCVLNKVSHFVNKLNVRYLGHWMVGNKLKEIITCATQAVVVTLVQGPGSGKTTILAKLKLAYELQGRDVVHFGPDSITNAWREEPGNATGTIPPDVMYKRLLRFLSRAVARGDLLLLDMCNDTANMIKLIIESGAKVVMGSFIKSVTATTKKGLVANFVDPEYLKFVQANVQSRIQSTAMNGSTLCGEKAIKICASKTAGCLHQVLTRGVKRYDSNPATHPVSIDEAVQMLMVDIDAALDSKAVSTIKSFVGVPMTNGHPVNHREGFWIVENPHVTIVPPTNTLNLYIDHIAEEFLYNLTAPIETKNTVVHHVQHDKLGSLHITRQVRKDHKPFEAKAEILLVNLEGQVYSSTAGFKVFM